jgi:hypothetical protein
MVCALCGGVSLSRQGWCGLADCCCCAPSTRCCSFGASGVRFGGEGFVEVLAATQTPTDKEWFQVGLLLISQSWLAAADATWHCHGE